MEEMPKRIEAVYQDSLANIMFIRKQQWTVTGYALAAQAAVYIVAKESAEQWVKILFVFFARWEVCTASSRYAIYLPEFKSFAIGWNGSTKILSRQTSAMGLRSDTRIRNETIGCLTAFTELSS